MRGDGGRLVAGQDRSVRPRGARAAVTVLPLDTSKPYGQPTTSGTTRSRRAAEPSGRSKSWYPRGEHRPPALTVAGTDVVICSTDAVVLRLYVTFGLASALERPMRHRSGRHAADAPDGNDERCRPTLRASAGDRGGRALTSGGPEIAAGIAANGRGRLRGTGPSWECSTSPTAVTSKASSNLHHKPTGTADGWRTAARTRPGRIRQCRHDGPDLNGSGLAPRSPMTYKPAPSSRVAGTGRAGSTVSPSPPGRRWPEGRSSRATARHVGALSAFRAGAASSPSTPRGSTVRDDIAGLDPTSSSERCRPRGAVDERPMAPSGDRGPRPRPATGDAGSTPAAWQHVAVRMLTSGTTAAQAHRPHRRHLERRRFRAYYEKTRPPHPPGVMSPVNSPCAPGGVPHPAVGQRRPVDSC